MTDLPGSRSQPSGESDIQQAIALHLQGRLSEAELIYTAILAEDPGEFDALHLLGLTKLQQGHAIEALRLIAAALKANPNSPDALSNYGLVLDALKRHREALESFDQALALKRDHANALNNRGLTLATLGRTAEALASWDLALAANPNHLDSLHNRGNAVHNLKRHAAALADYERVLAVRPDTLDVLNNCGGSLSELGRFREAIECYDRALAVNPNLPELLINKGHVLADLHEFEDALSCYAEAAAFEPRRAEAKWSASLVRLRLGQFAEGWRGYEWRWRQAHWAARRRDFVAPLWLGEEDLTGRTILLHAEQGFGDTLQFVRYVPLVARLGSTVLLEVQSPLKSLLSRLSGASQIFARGETLPPFDLHCPLMSLPLAFRTLLDTIPADIPYLQPPSDQTAKWQRRLGDKRSPRVGIAWAGNSVHESDRTRSIALERFASLLSVPGIEFFSLQKDLSPTDTCTLRSHAQVTDIGAELGDFADTAAVISLLDLVVSADTSVAHLAGALGRPVRVLLPFLPDFRWLLEREDSPWYPTAQLFRQPRLGDWESVIARVHSELGSLGNSVERAA